MSRFQPKPAWIKVRPPAGPTFNRISSLLRTKNLHTVCEEARCPNIAECWQGGTATLMLLGDTCTRGCRFCSVTSGNPAGRIDSDEPVKAAETVRQMNLKYVVLTSVDRDDLPDGGADIFARTIETIHEQSPEVLVESLIPDFAGDPVALERVLEARPDVLAHNLETVRRLTPTVRDRRATYEQSLELLWRTKRIRSEQWTKSSIMLGLGETLDELRTAMKDLRAVDVDFLTLGQYLRPTEKHLPVVEFVSPELFAQLEREALGIGFSYAASGPLVRSSYRAGEYFLSSIVKGKRPPSIQILPVVEA